MHGHDNCRNVQNLLWAAALQTDQKAKNAFCHSVSVASVLNGPITTVCTAVRLHSIGSCSLYGKRHTERAEKIEDQRHGKFPANARNRVACFALLQFHLNFRVDRNYYGRIRLSKGGVTPSF